MEQLITLDECARRLGVVLHVLTRLVKAGTIKAAKSPSGEILVSEEEAKVSINKSRFEHLRGQAITVTEASEKYNVNRRAILYWISYGHITVLTHGYRQQLDEADVAYCVAAYHKKGGGRGKRILDELGRPYKYKQTKQAIYRREYRKRKAIEKAQSV